jgi:hypothetical protein
MAVRNPPVTMVLPLPGEYFYQAKGRNIKLILFQRESRLGAVELPAAVDLDRRNIEAAEVASDVGLAEARVADHLAPEPIVSELSPRAKVAVLAVLVAASWITVFYLASAAFRLASAIANLVSP